MYFIRFLVVKLANVSTDRFTSLTTKMTYKMNHDFNYMLLLYNRVCCMLYILFFIYGMVYNACQWSSY